MKKIIAVIGSHDADAKLAKMAEEVGREVAKLGCILVCGGLGGIMEAACKGTKEAGGMTIGIIPGNNKNDANKYVDIVIPTGMGYARNVLVVKAADIVIALPGEYGTLSEIAYAMQMEKPTIGIGTWDIPGIIKADSPKEAIEKVKACL